MSGAADHLRAQFEHEAAVHAAAWWAGRLRDAAGVGDNGADDRTAALTYGMIHLIRSRHPPTAANCERFERELANGIAAVFQSRSVSARWYYDQPGFDDGGVCLVLSVDYHPCSILHSALIAAGIEKGVAEMAALPLKTVMKVSARRILLAHGYGARWREIYGPLWGSSYEEHCAVEAVRSAALNVAYDDYYDNGRQGKQPHDWYGPVPR